MGGQAVALQVAVFSDVVCPWCYIGKRRLEKALKAAGGRYEHHVTWRAFELNPDMPPDGMERTEYLEAKFGSPEAFRRLEARMAAAAAGEGIPFAWDRVRRTPNTFDAHRLIWLAEREGLQDAVVEVLFRGYFVEGADLGQRRTLLDLAAEAGLNTGRVEEMLASQESAVAVREDEARARQMGIGGVPHFLINGREHLSGAHPPETLESAFDRAMRVAAR